jgi:transcriptional regulator with XRE-family HTH domain
MSDVQRPPTVGRIQQLAAEEIRVLLARRRMSAAELARRIGQKPQALSRRMIGDIPFDLHDLEVIANALGVEVKDLIAGDGSGADTTRRYNGQAGRLMTIPGQRSRDRPDGRPEQVVTSPTTRRPDRVDTARAA